MSWPTRRVRTADGPHGPIDLHLIDTGPPSGSADRGTVVLAHGFPESSHSWRHQIAPLHAAGYRVLVPDQRGYGASSAPRVVEAYRSDHLSADLVALLDDIGADDAVFVGHDWGALLTWDLARFHPGRVRGLINVSVPYNPWPAPPTDVFRAMFGDRFFYILYFQQVGPAETELDADVRRTLHHVLWAGSGEMIGPPPTELLPADGTTFVQAMTHGKDVPAIEELPHWLTPDDLDTYVEQFTTSGFFGPVSWYRNLDADHELTKDLPHPAMPTAFIGGRNDMVIAHRLELVDAMEAVLPDYRDTVLLDDAGHWTQQERPDEFNAALLDLLDRLG